MKKLTKNEKENEGQRKHSNIIHQKKQLYFVVKSDTMKYCPVWRFLIEMKQWRSFGKIRSCFMFSPHHSPIAWKSWLLFLPEKNVSFWKGAVNACYILCCLEKSVIASSFWEIYCRKPVSRLYQEPPFNNTELTLSETVLVKHSTTQPSVHSI